jgi:hypothetical protein
MVSRALPRSNRSHERRLYSRSAAPLAVALAILLAILSAPHHSRADVGDCSQPASSGSTVVASDCLYILRTAVGLETCSPACICAPKGTLPTSASDALVCLKKVVGQDIVLACPCGSATTTTAPGGTTTTLGATTTLPHATTTTTTGGPTTTTTSTTSTTVLSGFAEASDAQLDRLDEVLGAATAMLEAGSSYADVAAMLSAEPDVSGVFSNGITLFFTVAGIPTGIHDGVAARLGGPGHEVIEPATALRRATRDRRSSKLELPRTNALASAPVSAAAADGNLPIGQRVVGMDDDSDGKRDLPKYALILAPYAFYFEPYDSAFDVQELLLMQRDYQEGGVVTKANDQDFTIDSLSISDYIDWTDYDVIYISSHGDADASAPFGPDPFILLGISGTKCKSLGTKVKQDLPAKADRLGLYCIATNLTTDDSNPTWGFDLIGTKSFWQHNHGGKLRKKVIVFESCRSTFTPGLAEALAGEDSIFLGWDEYVNADHSQATQSKLFSQAAGLGFPMLKGFVRSCIDGSCIEPLSSGDPDEPNGYDGTKPAELLAAWNRADLRIREGLKLPGDPTPGICFEISGVPLAATCPSCDGTLPLSVMYDAVVEGLEPEDLVLRQDPYEFATENLRLFADVDGADSGYAEVLFTERMSDLGDGAYAFDPAVTLYANGICPGDMFEYTPWVLLPAFDPAMPENDARDRLYSWDPPWIVTPSQGPPLLRSGSSGRPPSH